MVPRLKSWLWISGTFLALQAVSLAYVFNNYTWPSGTQIEMHLQLVRPAVPLQDGSASWNASAADALAIWNQYIAKVHFVESGPASEGARDGVNSVSFANNVYGDAWGTATLAITFTYSQPANYIASESDVIFNNNRKWNSYRGPQQGSGSTGTYDLHRVALHEFGHVLGLDHPDTHGQPGREAIMNSIISDLDHLADDDIAGGKALYGVSITSSQYPQYATSGNPFSYQTTANNSPTNYSASGLPPGLQVNADTGLISGRCTTSGPFKIDLAVEGSLGIARGSFQLNVAPMPITSSTFPPQILIGDGFSYQITAGNNPSSFSATGLPAGLSINTSTGLISGTPTVTGTFSVTVRAIGPTSEAGANVQISISGPRITSSSYLPPVEAGESLTYQITATHNPNSFAATNLPAGLRLDSATGLISGTPVAAGYFNWNVTAQTSYGIASGYLTLEVRGPRITSASSATTLIGRPFTYQITGSQSPTAFDATSLPVGLSINKTTGMISGVPSLSGTNYVNLTTATAYGTGRGTLYLNVQPDASTQFPAATFPALNGRILADPSGSRMFVQSPNKITVIDVNALAIIAEIFPPAAITDAALSLDATRLWIAHGGLRQSLSRIDLKTLQLLPELPTPVFVRHVREGLAGKLFVTDLSGATLQLDAATGAQQASFRQTSLDPLFEVSPDGKTLYIGDTYSAPAILARFDVSGVTPVFLQQTDQLGGTANSFAISHNGTLLAYGLTSGTAYTTGTYLLSASDLTQVKGNFTVGLFTPIAFSADDSLAYRANFTRTAIEAYDTRTFQKVSTVGLLANASANDYPVAIDSRNRYLFVPTNSGMQVYSLERPAPPAPHSLLNVSTRLATGTGDNVLIGGFIISGAESKRVVLRAIGPSLPVPGKLGDPQLELHGPNGTLTNDNWNSNRFDILATGVPPSNERESAIVASLSPGAYTAILSGLSGTTGVALVELYDLSAASNSRIANISTRGNVGTGDNVMIGGFIIGGGQPTRVIVRAIGPSLGSRGVAGALADTTLDLHDGNGTKFASNDDWQSDQAQEIIDSTIQPSDPRESALIRTLQPGNYTAIVRGKNQTTGVALVEVYNLETN